MTLLTLLMELWWAIIEAPLSALVGAAFILGFLANSAVRLLAYLVGRELL